MRWFKSLRWHRTDGFRGDIWLVVMSAIGLMTGIFSLLREWLSIFYPRAANTARLFNASLVTCFFVAVLIVIYRQRSTIASLERALDGKERIYLLRADFGNYLAEGERLTDELRRGIQEYGPWLRKRAEWVQRVSDFLISIGFPDDAAAFRHAGEDDADKNQLQGSDQALYWYRFYRGQLDKWRAKLAEIAARRLN